LQCRVGGSFSRLKENIFCGFLFKNPKHICVTGFTLGLQFCLLKRQFFYQLANVVYECRILAQGERSVIETSFSNGLRRYCIKKLPLICQYYNRTLELYKIVHFFKDNSEVRFFQYILALHFYVQSVPYSILEYCTLRKINFRLHAPWAIKLFERTKVAGKLGNIYISNLKS